MLTHIVISNVNVNFYIFSIIKAHYVNNRELLSAISLFLNNVIL